MTTHELNSKIVGVVPISVYEPNHITIEEVNGTKYVCQMSVDGVPHFTDLPDGNWQILSLASEMTEEKSTTLGMTLKEFKSWCKAEELVIKIDAPNCGCHGPSDLGACSGCDEWVEAQKLAKEYLIIWRDK